MNRSWILGRRSTKFDPRTFFYKNLLSKLFKLSFEKEIVYNLFRDSYEERMIVQITVFLLKIKTQTQSSELQLHNMQLV